MIKSSGVVFALLCLVASSLATPHWESSGEAHSYVQINSLSVHPERPVPGQEAEVSIVGTIADDITAGTLQVVVEHAGLEIFNHAFDICSFSPDVTCPIPSGQVRFTKAITLPSVLPKGKYKVSISARDGHSRDLAFVTTEVEVSLSLDDEVLSDDMIDSINAAGYWTAARTPMFEGKKWGDVVHMFRSGVRRRGEARRAPAAAPARSSVLSGSSVPEAFDVRKAWPGCITPIHDRGTCGATWALAATEVASDRFCIASKGTKNITLSAQLLVSCDRTEHGCSGGSQEGPWAYMVFLGLPTEECIPWHASVGRDDCRGMCRDGSELKLYFVVEGSVKDFEGEEAAQIEMVANGPVETRMDVWEDFAAYHSGVYRHVSGEFVGSQTVRVLGWGTESGTPYWLAANSLGAQWGESGLFKILRGSDECEFEEEFYCATPKLSA